jgi:hypothetical protein
MCRFQCGILKEQAEGPIVILPVLRKSGDGAEEEDEIEED